MNIQAKLLCAVAMSGFAAFALSVPAQALTRRNAAPNTRLPRPPGRSAGRSGNDSAVRPNAAPTPRPPRPPLPYCAAPAPAAKEAKKEAAPAAARVAGRTAVYPNAASIRNTPRRVPARRGCTPCRSVQRHAQQRQWRPEVDHKRAAATANAPRSGRARPEAILPGAAGDTPAAPEYPSFAHDLVAKPHTPWRIMRRLRSAFRPTWRSVARACAGRVRETAGSGRR